MISYLSRIFFEECSQLVRIGELRSSKLCINQWEVLQNYLYSNECHFRDDLGVKHPSRSALRLKANNNSSLRKFYCPQGCLSAFFNVKRTPGGSSVEGDSRGKLKKDCFRSNVRCCSRSSCCGETDFCGPLPENPQKSKILAFLLIRQFLQLDNSRR